MKGYLIDLKGGRTINKSIWHDMHIQVTMLLSKCDRAYLVFDFQLKNKFFDVF